MKKEVDLWMEDGKPKGIIIGDDFYFIADKRQVSYKATLIQTPIEQPVKETTSNAKKGMTLEHQQKMGVHYIGRCDGMRIIKELVDELDGVYHETRRKHIIRKYYPVASDSSLKRYSATYESFAGGKRDRKYRKRKSKKVGRKIGADRGAVIAQMGHTKVYENILNDFKEAIKRHQSTRAVFLKYIPNAKASTLKTYKSLYIRYLRDYENHEIKTQTKKTIIRGKSYRKKPPAGTYGYSKTYQTWIREKEVGGVLKAIQTVRYNYKPTSEVIAHETGMTRHRVLATLSLLQEQDKIGYNTDKLTPIYFVK